MLASHHVFKTCAFTSQSTTQSFCNQYSPRTAYGSSTNYWRMHILHHFCGPRIKTVRCSHWQLPQQEGCPWTSWNSYIHCMNTLRVVPSLRWNLTKRNHSNTSLLSEHGLDLPLHCHIPSRAIFSGSENLLVHKQRHGQSLFLGHLFHAAPKSPDRIWWAIANPATGPDILSVYISQLGKQLATNHACSIHNFSGSSSVNFSAAA